MTSPGKKSAPCVKGFAGGLRHRTGAAATNLDLAGAAVAVFVVHAILGRTTDRHVPLRFHWNVASARINRAIAAQRKGRTTGFAGTGGAIAGHGDAVTHTTTLAVACTGRYVALQSGHGLHLAYQI